MRTPPDAETPPCVQHGEASKDDQSANPITISHSKWRQEYKVYPAADVFPMMSDDELKVLGEDIKKNGLRSPITVLNNPGKVALPILIDGRNRLEAMERAGVFLTHIDRHTLSDPDPVSFIISKNIHRRHLTKQQQADLIVAAIKVGEAARQRAADQAKADKYIGPDGTPPKLPQFEVVSKGGRGKVNPIKQKAIAAAKEHGISKATVERSLAKSEGRTPKHRPKWARSDARPEPAPGRAATSPLPKPKSSAAIVGIDAVRKCYLDRCVDPAVDLDFEQATILDAFKEIAGKRAMTRQTTH